MPCASDDDLRGMARKAHGSAERDELRMPDGKERVLVARRLRAGEHRINRYPREPFVDEMFIQRPAAELLRIVRSGIAISGLHEDERNKRSRTDRALLR